ncbi:MAG: hypothetical protein GX458_15000 [Phyllobacteriaceae bacterium]|nr:hypothetical protein [Phyllobacteriaceae bacterium]
MKAWVARRLRELALAGELGRRVDPPAAEDGAPAPPGIDRAERPAEPVAFAAVPPPPDRG